MYEITNQCKAETKISSGHNEHFQRAKLAKKEEKIYSRKTSELEAKHIETPTPSQEHITKYVSDTKELDIHRRLIDIKWSTHRATLHCVYPYMYTYSNWKFNWRRRTNDNCFQFYVDLEFLQHIRLLLHIYTVRRHEHSSSTTTIHHSHCIFLYV